MDERIIAQLEAEESALARKLEAVRGVLEVYGRSRVEGVTGRPVAAMPASYKMPRGDDYATEIRTKARELIVANGGKPTSTRDVVAHLEANGISIRGQNKGNAVSALLSRSANFQNIDRVGWTLVVPPPPQQLFVPPPPTSVPSPPPSIPVSAAGWPPARPATSFLPPSQEGGGSYPTTVAS